MLLPINKYRPQNLKVVSWDEIEDQFNRYFGEQYKDSIAELVRHIKSTGLSERLFGCRCWMTKLVVGISDPIEWNREALHIEFNIEKDQWHFYYYAMPYREPEFVRYYPKEKGIEKFEYFIKIMGW